MILYSTGCPKCNVIKKKLALKNIQYEEITDENIIREKGFQSVPILEVDGKIYEFSEANQYINSL